MRRHARKCTHAYARKKLFAFLRVNKCKLTRIQVHVHIYARVYTHSIVYTCTQFAQTNGLTTRTRVYIITASNAMPKPYLYTYVRTHVRACGRSRTILANECKRTRTQINARKLIIVIDAWAIFVCKRNCDLRVRSKTFSVYYT